MNYCETVLDKVNIKLNDNFYYYLSGLIEGDGTLITPKSEKSLKGKLNYPSVEIVFNLKDLPLALIIQRELSFGSLSRLKGINAYRLTINGKQDILFIINMLNGRMKTTKIIDLWKLIDWFNLYNENINIIKKPLCNNHILSDAWFSGFIDTNGHFAIRTTKSNKQIKIECKFIIVQSKLDHNKNDKKDILIKIASSLLTTLKSIRNNKPKAEYSLRTTNLKGNLVLKNYLNSYPLFSSKYLDFCDWLKVLTLFEEGKVNHKDKIDYSINIKKGINNNRKLFTWDHLQKFYSLNK